jgi:hypothetical protein
MALLMLRNVSERGIPFLAGLFSSVQMWDYSV